MKKKISVIIITRNESANIKECLESVSFADEIVLLDSGSTDDTRALAESLGALVFNSAEWPGFGPQKNRALGYAQGEWILSIDADERISKKLREEIEYVVANADFDAYKIPRRTNFCGQWIDHCGWSPDFVMRLFRRGVASFSGDLVHEQLELSNNTNTIGYLKNSILHYSYPTPSHMWVKIDAYSTAWANQRARQGQHASILRAIASGCFAFVRCYFLRLGFLDGSMGFVVCFFQAQATFAKYFSLHCLGKNTESENR